MFDSTTTHMQNLSSSALIEDSLRRREGYLSADGALLVETGAHTGRSPKDKFIVRDDTTDRSVWWENNAAMTPRHFVCLLEDFELHMSTLKLYGQHLFAAAAPSHRIGVNVITEYAWHSLFMCNLLIRPNEKQLESFATDFTIINLPTFKADPKRHGCHSETVIACDFTNRIVLIGGTAYAGEMKKAVFTYLNFILPAKGVLPMHCSANIGADDSTAIFFGLSGTGKTTLSADPARLLVGDDEHGWGEDGIFNFEGGCYAKAVRLTAESEPEIYAAAIRSGTVLENVGFDSATRNINFDDQSKTENTRAAYPLNFIANASASGQAAHPKTIIMLTCDAFGILPPIAKLSPELAVQHFLAGYTAKVAGTERGVTEPQATFSACFGAPFMPRPPQVYGDLFHRKIVEHNVPCWLINTGWTGGPYGQGQRMPLATTRAILRHVLDGSLKAVTFRIDENFGFEVPTSVPGLTNTVLNPRLTWADPSAYDAHAKRLLDMFHDNKRKRDRLGAAWSADAQAKNRLWSRLENETFE
jgi:phosphoenolpyruvate carboxykinase (ATP)